MNAQHTDVAVLEGFIEGVHSGLAKHFAGRGLHTTIEVLIDGQPARWRMDGPVLLSQTLDTLLGERTTKPDLGDASFLIRISFEQASPDGRAGEPNQPLEMHDPPSRTAEVTKPGRTTASAVRPRWWVYAGMMITLLLGLLLVGVRCRLKLMSLPDTQHQPDAPAVDLPKALLVTQLEELDSKPKEHKRGEPISVAPGAFRRSSATIPRQWWSRCGYLREGGLVIRCGESARARK